MSHFPFLSPLPMHIPDGFLSILVSIIFWVLSIIMIGFALRKTNQTIGERQIPLMGVLAAAIFAGQMLNFSVTGGTSGHLLGATLATIILGPWAAILVMTSVVAVQALVFQDGGILTLGANFFNMAIVGVFVSYAVYTISMRYLRNSKWGMVVSGFLAAWSSIFIASLSCSLQLTISGTSPANIVIPAMGAIHALIGIGEGLITTGALVFISSARKDLLQNAGSAAEVSKGVLSGGVLLALVLTVLAPLASSHPDGLEWVAEQHGFLANARDAFYQIIPDYIFPGISNPALATIAAGIMGIVIVFGVAWGLARVNKAGRGQKSI